MNYTLEQMMDDRAMIDMLNTIRDTTTDLLKLGAVDRVTVQSTNDRVYLNGIPAEAFYHPEVRKFLQLTNQESLIDKVEVMHSDTSFEDVMKHYGVKGMKWGRRKGQSSSSESMSNKNIEETISRRKKEGISKETTDKEIRLMERRKKQGAPVGNENDSPEQRKEYKAMQKEADSWANDYVNERVKKGTLDKKFAETDKQEESAALKEVLGLTYSYKEDREIKHYGVLGMKWGRRKKDTTRHASDDAKRVHALKKKHVSELTNAELKEVNERLGKEKQFRDLQPEKVSLGKKLMKDVVGKSAQNVAQKYVQSTFEKAVFGDKDKSKATTEGAKKAANAAKQKVKQLI